MSQSLIKSKSRWKAMSLVVLVLAVLAMGAWWWRGPQVQVVQVIRRDFVQTVVASGHVETAHRVDIGSQMMGTVKRVLVSEGQAVKGDELLIELDDAEVQAAAQQAEAARAQAQAHVRAMREVQGPVAEQTLRQARVNLDNARQVYQRNQDLFQKQFIGQAALDDSRKAMELADAQVRSAQKQFDATTSNGSDFAMTEAAESEAKAGEQAAKVRAGYARIKAPTAGTIIARNVEVGDMAQPGKALLTLSPQGLLQLVVQIDEKNLRLLAVGQAALASADAFADQRFPARLSFINPAVNVQTGAVEVKLDVANPPSILRQDMTVSVDIETARRSHVLVLPTATLHDADTATPWVLCVEHGRVVRRNVRPGLRSNGVLEVLDGVAEGDLILPANSQIAAGARVRAVLRAH